MLEVAPWLARTDVGPRAVEAGTCPRCDERPVLLPTCGPVAWTALCRDCADEVGDEAWCDGHRADGRRAREWAATLDADWATTTHLWWIATGEVRADARWLHAARRVLPDLALRGPTGRP